MKKRYTDKGVMDMNMMLRQFLALFLMFSGILLPVFSAEEKEVEISDDIRAKPLVVMKQAEINGRVFFLAEDDEDYVASDLIIKVLTEDEEKVIQETTTDENGRYVLKNLDAGKYRFMVGLLRLRLRVEDSTEAVGKEKVSKKILVFIPVALGGRRIDSGD